MTDRIHGVWTRVISTVKHALEVPMVPEYAEARQRYSQFTRYSNTY